MRQWAEIYRLLLSVLSREIVSFEDVVSGLRIMAEGYAHNHEARVELVYLLAFVKDSWNYVNSDQVN